jgi:hypothetical protein
LGAFASDVEVSRIVLLNDLNIAVARTGFLNMEAVARTYRYLTQTVAAQQQQRRSQAAPGKPRQMMKRRATCVLLCGPALLLRLVARISDCGSCKRLKKRRAEIDPLPQKAFTVCLRGV